MRLRTRGQRRPLAADGKLADEEEERELRGKRSQAVPGVHSAIFNPAAHEMAIYQTLMLPGLEFTNRGETNVRDCIAVLADKLELTS